MDIVYTAEQEEIRPRLAAANINPESFLATDYLNHFNEIVMLLEMVPDMPELFEEAMEWEPRSYPEHFRCSGFAAKDLAIEAFHKAPSIIKAAFEDQCSILDKTIKSTLNGLATVNAVDRGLSADAQGLIRNRVTLIQSLLMDLNGIIHGKMPSGEHKAEELEALEIPEAESGDDVQTQEDIDKLFS